MSENDMIFVVTTALFFVLMLLNATASERV